MCSFFTDEFFQDNLTLAVLQSKYINNANEYYDRIKEVLLDEGIVLDYESKEKWTIQFTAENLLYKISIDYSMQVVHLITKLPNITISPEKRAETTNFLKNTELHIPLGRFDLPSDGTIWFNISYSFVNQEFNKVSFLLLLYWMELFSNLYWKDIFNWQQMNK